MNKYRNALPQLTDTLLLSDGGLETTLVFHDGMDLAEFAAFPLLRTEGGRDRLRRYFADYIQVAQRHGTGFVLESVTWRANPDWGSRLGFDEAELAELNRQSIRFLEALRDQYERPGQPMVISGCIGPRGDGYLPGALMNADQAADYHGAQVRIFAETNADLVTAMTLNYADEAIGIVRAAQDAAIPAVISFTVETDGRLPDGTRLGDAIQQVDQATGDGPAYYMINCAHPTHFREVLRGDWIRRVRGVRANASCRSHAELDEATELDEGDPRELGAQYLELLDLVPTLTVLGGCCGTDHRHVGAIGAACAGHRQPRAATA